MRNLINKNNCAKFDNYAGDVYNYTGGVSI